MRAGRTGGTGRRGAAGGAFLARTGILYCIDALPRGGGTENQLRGLIERLDRARFAPHLCTLRDDPREGPLPDCGRLRLRARSLARPGFWHGVRDLAGYLRRERIAVVQSFFQDATVLAALAGRLAGTPVRLASFRDLGFWRNRRQEWLLRRVYPGLTGFVANSEAVKAHFCAADRLDPARVTVIPNGLDAAAFPCVEHPEAAGATVGIVGNLNRPVKRTDLFVRAAGLVSPRHPTARWQVLGDGHLRPGLEALAREVGVGEALAFAGHVRDVPERLRGWAVGVICSDTEGFSNAVLEYMLSGCAVVATDVGGNREAVRHGETGLLVPPGDAQALADAVGALLDDPPRRVAMARRARAHAAAAYGWDRCVAAHADLYGRLLRGAGVSA